MRKFWALYAGAALSVVGAVMVTQAQFPAYSIEALPGIDVLSYGVDLSVPVPSADPQTGLSPIRVHAQIRLRITEPKQEIVLHADSTTLRELLIRVEQVETTPYWESVDLLHIPLPVAAEAGSEIFLSMDYLVSEIEDGSIATAENLPVFARKWLPSHDHASDPAPFEIHIEVPNGWSTSGPGHLLNEQGTVIPSDLERKIFHWKAYKRGN